VSVLASDCPDDISQPLVPARLPAATTPVPLAVDARPFSPSQSSGVPHWSFLLPIVDEVVPEVEFDILFNKLRRPRGSRNKLGEAFLDKLYQHWLEHGDDAIVRACNENPAGYLRVIASIVPKQLEIERNPFDGVTDDELAALIAAARDALGIAEKFEGEKDESQ
jgi:hypothetical protein